MAGDHIRRVYDSMLDLLPDADHPTPLVRLSRVVPFRHARIYAKLEWYNPFGAVKDRVAANLVEDAEARGVLGPGKRLVEATSGNTGLGLAMIGNARGYPLQTPLSTAIPLEKRTVLRFFGSDVVELDDSLCPAPGAPEGAIAHARDTADWEPDTVLLDQYGNEANPGAHYRTTGPEIWRQTDGAVTHFVAGLGTCGTITGTGRYLKEQRAGVKVLGVYPEEGHDIPGVRSKRQLAQTRLYVPDEYDGDVEVSDRESFDLCLRLNREESVIAGPSSGMALAGALRLVPDEPGVVAVVIFPDNIFKYASSVCRHFVSLCPEPADTHAAPAPSRQEQLLATMLDNLKNPYDSVRVTTLAEELAAGERPMILDVRPADQFADVHMAEATNLPQGDLIERTSELPEDRDTPIVTVCAVGRTSKEATLYLKSLGYRNVRNLKGGIAEWIRKGHPTERAATRT